MERPELELDTPGGLCEALRGGGGENPRGPQGWPRPSSRCRPAGRLPALRDGAMRGPCGVVTAAAWADAEDSGLLRLLAPRPMVAGGWKARPRQGRAKPPCPAELSEVLAASPPETSAAAAVGCSTRMAEGLDRWGHLTLTWPQVSTGGVDSELCCDKSFLRPRLSLGDGGLAGTRRPSPSPGRGPRLGAAEQLATCPGHKRGRQGRAR